MHFYFDHRLVEKKLFTKRAMGSIYTNEDIIATSQNTETQGILFLFVIRVVHGG
jgi:hypothetical protein